jgi:hypothetical protein
MSLVASNAQLSWGWMPRFALLGRASTSWLHPCS